MSGSHPGHPTLLRMTPSPHTRFDPVRRRLLLAGAGAVVLAACGNTTPAAAPATTVAAGRTGARSLSLLRVFAPEQPAGSPLRLPLAFADSDGVPTAEVPDTIAVRAVAPSGVAGDPVVVDRHGVGIPTPYFPYEHTFDEVGTWGLVIDVGGDETETALTVRAAHELPAVPGPGDRLPVIPTLTVAVPLGIDPICTANPRCPLHDVSLDDALARALPVVLLVSTPAFCQTAICGPVLDLVVERHGTLAEQTTFIHAEVYTDGQARQTAPVVDVLGLRHEPSLFTARADGTVVSRLDYTFDATELDAAVGALVGE